MATCPGSLIIHADATVVSCTEDDERDGCRGRDLRHEGDPVRCWEWTLPGCNYCGVQYCATKPVRQRAQHAKQVAAARSPY